MSRARILADIRAALAHPAPASLEHPPPRPAPPTAPAPSDLIERFQSRFEGLGGKWHVAQRTGDLAELVERLAGTGIALVSQDPAGKLAGAALATELERRGVRVVARPTLESANQIRVCVTGVTVAIADSGTVGLLASPDQGRLASLIGPVHVAVITRSDVVANLSDYLARAERALAPRDSSAGLLITGPSRTADIEGQLIVGVHGPGEIHVVLLPDAV